MNTVSIVFQPIKHGPWLEADKLQLGRVAGIQLQDGRHSVPVVAFTQHGRWMTAGYTVALHDSAFSMSLASPRCLDT